MLSFISQTPYLYTKNLIGRIAFALICRVFDIWLIIWCIFKRLIDIVDALYKIKPNLVWNIIQWRVFIILLLNAISWFFIDIIMAEIRDYSIRPKHILFFHILWSYKCLPGYSQATFGFTETFGHGYINTGMLCIWFWNA